MAIIKAKNGNILHVEDQSTIDDLVAQGHKLVEGKSTPSARRRQPAGTEGSTSESEAPAGDEPVVDEPVA